MGKDTHFLAHTLPRALSYALPVTHYSSKEISLCGKPILHRSVWARWQKNWHLPTIAELTKKGDLNFIAVCDIDETKASEVGKTVRLAILYRCRGDAGETQGYRCRRHLRRRL